MLKRISLEETAEETDERLSKQSERQACLRASRGLWQRTMRLQVQVVRQPRLRAL